MPTNLSDASLLSRVTLERFVGTFFSKIFFRLSNWKFSLTSVPCLQICLLCHYLVVSHQRFVGTFFSKKFSTFILREMTIFSYFPALLSWQPFHVPDDLELRKSADTELFTPHLVSEHLEVSRIQWWCRKNADFRFEFCENWWFSAISPHCWDDNIFMFPLT